jgi:hypothetical protein
LRTARGAGRRLEELRFFEVGRFLAVLRDRELVPAFLDVLRLRDRVGEDVRVAMLTTLLIRHISPMYHGSVSLPQTHLGHAEILGVDRSVSHS